MGFGFGARISRLPGFAEDEGQLNLLVSMSRLLAWVLSAPPLAQAGLSLYFLFPAFMPSSLHRQNSTARARVQHCPGRTPLHVFW